MSFNLNYKELQAVPAAEAKEFLGSSACYAPECVKDFVAIAIDGLVARYGDNVKVVVQGNGHLFAGDDHQHDISSVNMIVKRADTSA